jgi:anti-sigma regulatory factor (Ser/Thr protein kinase)
MAADEITLTLPRAPEFQRVAHLVLGGLAARLNLTVDNLEDLQLALDAVLDRMAPNSGDVTVQLSLRDGELETRIGPLLPELLDELERDADGEELWVRRVLDSTVDDVHVDGEWVRLTKKVATVA